MRLCLIRHFAPDVAPGVCYGQTDLSLKDTEAAQARQLIMLRQQLHDVVAASAPVFSSPLKRCALLAAALSSDFATDPRLRELHFGDWEMQPWEAISPLALDAWAEDVAGFRPPGGESGYELQQRALAWLRDVGGVHDQIIAVTHGGVIRALQAHHQALPGSQWLNLRYSYGEIVRLEFTSEQMNAPPVQ